ncbi:hypothetical protein BH11BAC6_BH11BAC6_13280 [soil metagenome]
MKHVFSNSKALILAGLSVIVITAAAWQTDDKNKKDSTANRQQTGDTIVPKQFNYNKNELKLKDLDMAMKQLELSLKSLNVNLQGMDTFISKSVNEALSQVNFEEINKQVQAELKNIDFEKINREVQEELKKVDFNKIKIEINKSLKEAQEEIKNIDMTKMQNDMKELQLKINSGEFKQQVDEAMKDAKKEIEKVKQELQDLKDFINALQKDGLIDKSKGFTIEWTKDGNLIINGKTQPKEISDRYSRYYKKDGYKIKMNAGDDDVLDIESL